LAQRLRDIGAQLPSGGFEWLERHPPAVKRLWDDLLHLRKDQYIEWQFTVRTKVWSSDEDDVAESVRGPELSNDCELSVRWTGRGRVQTLSEDVYIFIYGEEPPGKREA
jgi:hypothetical protein